MNIKNFLIIFICYLFTACEPHMITKRVPIKAVDAAKESTILNFPTNSEDEFNMSRTVKMEQELNKRKYFIRAMEGEYRGEVKIAEINYYVVAQFIASIPIEISPEARSFEEISYELQNLRLHMHIKLENPKIQNSGGSCIIEDYFPNVTEGYIHVISESCKHIFKFDLAEAESAVAAALGSESTETETSTEVERPRPILRVKRTPKEIAELVVTQKLKVIEYLDTTFESSVGLKKHFFKLKKEL